MGIGYGGRNPKYFDGSSENKAASSALAIKKIYPNAIDGLYWIIMPGGIIKQTYCIMNDNWDGGGWMLAMKATRGTTFSYSSAHWTTPSLLNNTDLTLDDGDAKYECMNHYLAKDIAARFPDTNPGGTMGSNINGWSWNENSFNGGNRTTLINFFSTSPQTYLRQDADVIAWSGHGNNGPFSAQGGWRKYGFNLNDGARQTRWGFLWNNESTPGSNDVDSGIGMGSRPNYSAGDYVTCCQTYLGVNRSMRVEIWIR